MGGLSKGDSAASPDGDGLPNGVGSKHVTPKHRNKNRKNRMKKRKKNARRRGDKKKNNNHHQDSNNENNDIWDHSNPWEDCPPGGCNSNVIGDRERPNFKRDNNFRHDVSRDYDRRQEYGRYGEGGIPSTDENVLSDKPPRIRQQERSDVAIIKDLMRQEPSISASSAASSSKFMTTAAISYTCLSHLCCCCASYFLVIFLPFNNILHFHK
jgi:hypothetical protein